MGRVASISSAADSYVVADIGLADRVVPTDDPTTLEPKAPAPTPEAGFDLEKAMAGLPPGARRVFVLHDVEGRTHEEIASLLGLAPGTSKAQLHRARRLLGERLDA